MDERVTPWMRITQDQIDRFGDVTLDRDPMHIDPAYAATGPFGHTIAFGFLTLSLLTHFAHQAGLVSNDGYALNYGLNKVRFVSPVAVDSLIRARFRVVDSTPKAGGTLHRFAVTVEIEGGERPALVAEWLGLSLPFERDSAP